MGRYKPINMVTKLAMTNTHTHTHTDRVGFVSKVLTTISDRPISTVWVM